MAFSHGFGKMIFVVYNEMGFRTKDRGVMVMAQHTKDDINFHGFLNAMKKMQRVSYATLGKGIYSTNVMGKIVRGELLPKKLARDRIVARLGVSGEGYEDYLPMEEYADWELRQEVLKCIEEKDTDKLAALLKKLESMKLDKVEKQFLETMRYMMLKMQNVPEEELRKVIETAVSYTIPVIDEGFPKKLLLADQEINLLIEYVSLHRYGKTEEGNRSWRFERYEDIFRYIEQSRIDNIGKAKIYPKLVFYVCQEYQDNLVNIEDIRRCLELCNGAIELLRNTRRLYYFVELLETRQRLIKRLLESKVVSDEAIDCELRKVSAVSQEWAEVLIDLYIEYDVSPYMEDFGYLYLETESYCINDIIRIRRKMLGLTQIQVAKDACDERTVRRTEKHQMDPQMYAVRGMFKNLKLCPEYVRANVISYDPEAMKLHMELNRSINVRDYDVWKKCLDDLERQICMDIPQNQQIVMKNKLLLQLYLREMSPRDFSKQLQDVLEYTVPIKGILEPEDCYLTISEMDCLYNLAMWDDTLEGERYIETLQRLCTKLLENEQVKSRMSVMQLILTNLASKIGNSGQYMESTYLSDKILKYSLQTRRASNLVRNLYNKLWNDQRITSQELKTRDDAADNKVLKDCISLCDIAKLKSLKKTFEDKLNN